MVAKTEDSGLRSVPINTVLIASVARFKIHDWGHAAAAGVAAGDDLPAGFQGHADGVDTLAGADAGLTAGAEGPDTMEFSRN
jgi:hypothetical protein